MMSTLAKSIAHVIELNSGRLTGRTRLQKTFYFLESYGLGMGIDFQYHHYGPYSEELSIAIDDAIALGFISEEKRVTNNLQTYSIFSSIKENNEELLDDKADKVTAKLLSTLSEFDTITLELAATADFLSEAGFQDDPWLETRIRKASKATDERILKAKDLLRQIRALSGSFIN
jgi:uncharacterized protein